MQWRRAHAARQGAEGVLSRVFLYTCSSVQRRHWQEFKCHMQHVSAAESEGPLVARWHYMDATRSFLMEKDVGLDQRHEGACGISAKQCAVGATNGKKKKKTD